MKTIKSFIMLFALSALLLTSHFTFAQQGFSLKAAVGGHTSWIFNSGDNDIPGFSQKLYLQPALSLGSTYNFTKNIGLGLDLVYSLQGRKYELEAEEGRIALHYLKIPLYLHYNTNPEAIWIFTANAGPQISMLTKSSLFDADGNVNEDNIKDSCHDLSFGAYIGAGAEYKLTDNFNLFGQVRADMDFTNCENDKATDYTLGREKSYNATAGVQFGVRYIFGGISSIK